MKYVKKSKRFINTSYQIGMKEGNILQGNIYKSVLSVLNVTPMDGGKKMSRKGISGIGVLIIFIAMILVAAVAAMVLLQTVSSLEGQALATGKQAKGEVSSKFQVQSVVGEANVSNNSIVYLRISLKVAPGSPDFILNRTLLSYQTEHVIRTGIKYVKTPEGNNTAEGARNTVKGRTDVYTVVWLNKDANMSQAQKSAVMPEEIVEAWYYAKDLGPYDRVSLAITPNVGTVSRVYFTVPSVITKDVVPLFP
ncbi:hypothetical protein DRN74_04340 [Candidatus Micrarchaeota archaeon]|nr:MAG: hypothetical protein DRN74_04340 [Candidatus Micrarchaeota archaeon]